MPGGPSNTQKFVYKPYGDTGSGYYSDNMEGCYVIMNEITPIVLEAIETAEFTPSPGRPFTICDIGSSDGGTSMKLMRRCIERIRKTHGKDTEVNILYEDQPVNDFKSLMMRVNGLIPGIKTYLEDHDNVYFSAVGVTFFKQCCPSNSVQLAFSSNAIHYLSGRPCSLTDAVHHTQATDPEEKAKFAAHAAKDWETILLHRAKELAPGGRIVVAGICVDEKGRYMGATTPDSRNIFKFMGQLFRKMVKEGRITEAEYHNVLIHNYHRTVEEYSAPLKDTSSPVYKAGLRLKYCESHVLRCPYHEKWMKEGKKGDPEAMRAHAKWFLPTMRSWVNMQFVSCLSESRPLEERIALIDEFFLLYEDDVAKDPSQHMMENVDIFMLIHKEGSSEKLSQMNGHSNIEIL